jgi:HEAT repeat protein
VTSQGSAYGRFRRALDTGNAKIALAAAADLGHVGLADALELLLLMLESEPSRFERAALRWHGRYCREVSDVDIAEAQAVLACLGGLRGSRPEQSAHALADLVHRRDLARASEVLKRWGSTRPARTGRI